MPSFTSIQEMLATAGKIPTLKVGGVDDHTEFEPDGTMVMRGNATVHNDIVMTFDSAKVPPANAPSWDPFLGNLNAYTFGVGDYLELTEELLHGYKQGGALESHVHVVTNGLDTTDRYINFEFEFAAANISEAFPVDTTISISGDFLIPANTPDRTHYYLDIGDIVSVGIEIGAIGKGRVRRIASTGVAPSNNPFGLSVGMHFEADTIGSRQERVK